MNRQGLFRDVPYERCTYIHHRVRPTGQPYSELFLENLMTPSLLVGFALIILAGIMEGSYSFPLKVNPKWNWENTWSAGSLMAFLFVPWPLASWAVPGLVRVYFLLGSE